MADSVSTTAQTVPPSPPRFHPRRYVSVFTLLFLFGTETFLVSPMLPTIARNLHISVQASAYSVTAYVVVYAVCAPFLGLVSDRVGRRRMLIVGAALFVASNAVASFAGSLTVLIAARALSGIAAACAGPAVWAHISGTTEDSVRGRALGTGMACYSGGQVLGVPLGSLLAGVAGWRSAFLAIAIGTVLAVPLLVRQVPAPAAGSRGAGRGLGDAFTSWRHPALRRALLVNIAFNTANLGAYAFMGAMFARRFGLSVTSLGLVGILVGVGSVIGSTVGGRVGDRSRARGRVDLPMLPVWALVLAAGVALAAWGPGIAVALAGVLLWFVASGGFVTDQQTLAGTAAPELRATSSAWLTSTMYAGTAVGSWVIGRFSDLVLGAGLIAVALALTAALGALFVNARLRHPVGSGQREPAGAASGG